MPELHLSQPEFTYSASGTFTKHRERIKKLKKTDNSNYMYKNKLDKPCFAHVTAHADSKD